MTTFRGRLQLAAEEAEKRSPLLGDPWVETVSSLRGRHDRDGYERLSTQQIFDALGVPLHRRNGAVCQRLTQLMQAHGWRQIRLNPDGGAITARCRGYERPVTP